MLFGIYAVSLAAYGFSLVYFKKKWVQQQIAFLIIYIVGLMLVGTMDVLLSIYFVVSFLPFVLHLRHLSLNTVAFAGYLLIYVAIGLLLQNVNATLVTFIAKIWQFMVFFIVYDADISFEKSDYKATLYLAVIAESLIGIYLLRTSTHIATSGLIRLVFNAQPITGNISTAVLPIIVFYYIRVRNDIVKSRRLLVIIGISIVWVVLSGTRGYMLEFVTVVVLLYDYYSNKEVKKTTRTSRLLIIVALIGVAFLFVLLNPSIIKKIQALLRMNTGLGIRDYENAAIKDHLRNAPLLVLFFGIGLGGRGGAYSSLVDALSTQFSYGMWHRSKYMYGRGAIFHNLYANIALCLGIVGIGIVVLMNIGIWKRISVSCKNNRLERYALHLFHLSFLLMNYYRWSAVCGISEMIILALIVKNIKQENYSINNGHTVEKQLQQLL